MAKQNETTWAEVDVNTFKGDLAKKWAAYDKANEAMKAARAEFEALAKPRAEKDAPLGKEVAFSYRFGKLSLAFVDPRAKTPSANKITL